MKRLLPVVLSLAFAFNAHAAPSREAANNWLNDFSKIKVEILANAGRQKSYFELQIQPITELEERAKRLFTDKSKTPNPYIICIAAVSQFRAALGWQIKSLTSEAGSDVLSDRVTYLASTSFHAGAAYQRCEALIEGLN
ncbi:hypothetical protein [Achromobacter xylosoxidans]|uniref:hypothetical protein n=1 Tax=Alcaligenes xylosoxydans xylosoxydans TaxID=85698 RepID=UPI000FDC14F6|nr:hypothetical protein [Achromobacter xylosoxidans]MCH4576800.1 hypothetical protein [Achromobacter xylosoxidans]NYS12134.1 hypothetical protein [Achromobacter xylosoxidans]UXL05277.1 hypothetical protein N4T34_00670 [Achromobacter xylosoxidans]